MGNDREYSLCPSFPLVGLVEATLGTHTQTKVLGLLQVQRGHSCQVPAESQRPGPGASVRGELHSWEPLFSRNPQTALHFAPCQSLAKYLLLSPLTSLSSPASLTPVLLPCKSDTPGKDKCPEVSSDQASSMYWSLVGGICALLTQERLGTAVELKTGHREQRADGFCPHRLGSGEMG